jgi:hypothetical protein
MKYTIDGIPFKTKKAIKEYCSEIVGSRDHKYQLPAASQSFFFDLLKHHPDWKVKTQRRADDELELWVDWCYNAQYPTWGLMIYHKESGLRLDDISWHTAITAL